MKNMEVKIDLRPHYTFAYFSESIEFGDKDLLYYSRKDKSLHYKVKIGSYNIDEYIYPISDDDAKALQEVFGLVIDAHQSYFDHQGKPWKFHNGPDCTIICGRRRIHFEQPSVIEPVSFFCEMISMLILLDVDRPETTFKKLVHDIPLVKCLLKVYIESPALYMKRVGADKA